MNLTAANIDTSAIDAFLLCPTPERWIENALDNQHIMLIDHANCEKKAASTALNMLYRYVERADLLDKMARLAREELRHFEQVVDIMQRRNIDYIQLSSARYAAGMREGLRGQEPERLIDSLIIGAFIEARSCERFACVAPHLDDELKNFYLSLLKSEARHFEDYLALARQYAETPIDDRIDYYAQLECRLVETPDTEFRFHSGPVF